MEIDKLGITTLVAACCLLTLACSSTGPGVEAEVVAADEATAAGPVPAGGDETGAGAAGPVSPAARFLEDPEAVAFGRRYFRAVCTGYCHSTQAGLARDAPDLFDCSWRHGSSDEEVFRVIAEGVAGTEMLPFGGKLEDEVLWKIVAYLRAGSRCSSS